MQKLPKLIKEEEIWKDFKKEKKNSGQGCVTCKFYQALKRRIHGSSSKLLPNVEEEKIFPNLFYDMSMTKTSQENCWPVSLVNAETKIRVSPNE